MKTHLALLRTWVALVLETYPRICRKHLGIHAVPYPCLLPFKAQSPPVVLTGVTHLFPPDQIHTILCIAQVRKTRVRRQ